MARLQITGRAAGGVGVEILRRAAATGTRPGTMDTTVLGYGCGMAAFGVCRIAVAISVPGHWPGVLLLVGKGGTGWLCLEISGPEPAAPAPPI